LKKLPKGSEAYDNAYEDAMKRIEGQVADSKELAIQVLSWITLSKRPLTATEIQHALALEIGESELDEENLPEVKDILSVCSGLVTIDEESNVIRLVHYTTQEYLKRTQKKWFPNAETNITVICVSYLLFSVFESGFCQTDAEFKERLRLNQIYDYAATNWGNHARETSALCQEVIDSLESKLKVEAASQALLAIERYPGHSEYSQEVPRQMAGLHLTGYFGLKDAMIALFEN
jgi:hypothetical protein